MKLQRCIVLSLLLSCACLASAVESVARIVIPQIASYDINHEDYYFSQLLRLAMSKTVPTHGQYEIIYSPFYSADARLRSFVKKGKIDLLWSTTSPVFEKDMLPVKISLLKDLNNYRIMIIRPEDQPIFSKVKTLDDLRKLRGGMNPQWVDAEIMQKNNLPQVYAVGYGKLFKMLAAKRFDYFSRGLYQVQSEVNFYPHLHLTIEQDLLLHYNNEFYFFVNKNNKELAARIEMGLKISVADGSFDELFNSIPRYRWGMDELHNGKRQVIDLKSFKD